MKDNHDAQIMGVEAYLEELKEKALERGEPAPRKPVNANWTSYVTNDPVETSLAGTEKFYVKKVEGVTEVTAGEMATYTITEYNGEATDENKGKVKWCVFIDGEKTRRIQLSNRKVIDRKENDVDIYARNPKDPMLVLYARISPKEDKIELKFSKWLDGRVVTIEAYKNTPGDPNCQVKTQVKDDEIKIGGAEAVAKSQEQEEGGSNVPTILGISNSVVSNVLSDPKTYKLATKAFGISEAAAKFTPDKVDASLSYFGALVSLASLSQSHGGKNVSPMTVFGVTPLGGGWGSLGIALFSLVGEDIVNRQYEEQLEFNTWAAGSNIDILRSYVKGYGYNKLPVEKTLFFIYTSDKVGNEIFTITPTQVLFEGPEEAEKALGFKPEYLYYGIFEDIKFDPETGEFDYFIPNKRGAVKFE